MSNFNPRLVFHNENGSEVHLVVDPTSIANLTSLNNLELTFDYDNTDVNAKGIVSYPDKLEAMDELNSACNYLNRIVLGESIVNASGPLTYSTQYTFKTTKPTVKPGGSDTVTLDGSTTYELCISFLNGSERVTKKFVAGTSGTDITLNKRLSEVEGITSTSTNFLFWFNVKGINYLTAKGDRVRLDVSTTKKHIEVTGIPGALSSPAPSRRSRRSAEPNAYQSLASELNKARQRGLLAGEDPTLQSPVTESKSIFFTLINTPESGGSIISSLDGNLNRIDFSIGIYTRDSSTIGDIFSLFKSYRLYIFNNKYVETDVKESYVNSVNNNGYFFNMNSSKTKLLESDLVIFNSMFNRLEISNLVITSPIKISDLVLYLELETLDGDIITSKLPLSICYLGSNLGDNKWIHGNLSLPSDLGCQPTFDYMCRLDIQEEDTTLASKMSAVTSAKWSIEHFDKNQGKFLNLWSYTTFNRDLFTSVGLYDKRRLPNQKESTTEEFTNFMELVDNFPEANLDPDFSSYNQDDINLKKLGLPLFSPIIGSKLLLKERLIVILTLFNESGDVIGEYIKDIKSLPFTKYSNLDRNDFFTNTIYKLPYLTKSPGSSSINYLNRRYVEPINPSTTILNPLGHDNGSIKSFIGIKDNNISNLMLTSPYTLLAEPTDDKFNYVVFSTFDQLVDMIYSLSFANISTIDNGQSTYDIFKDNISRYTVRRPIKILVGNEIKDITTFINHSPTFQDTKEDIANCLKEKGISPSIFKPNPFNVNRRISILVYPGVDIVSYPLYMESFLVAFKEELPITSFGADNYLTTPLQLDSNRSWLDFNPDIGSNPTSFDTELKTFGTSKTLSSTIEPTTPNTTSFPDSKTYLPNYLKLFKSNFEFYGTIPFWLCTDKSLLGFTGDFVHRVEGYKKDQEVVHPITGDLYLCIKDRPGLKSTLSKSDFNSIEHTYPLDIGSYTVLDDQEYFVKISNNQGRAITDDLYSKYYKSSLPTYLSIISYLNLFINSNDGFLFNPYTTSDVDLSTTDRMFTLPDDKRFKAYINGSEVSITKGYFPYKYLESYLKAMANNESDYTFDKSDLDTELRRAKEDSEFGAWFKLKNLNTHSFIYYSTRPLLWVYDKSIIARANISHPRFNLIRVGDRFYYLRLVTDQFYPEDDCCMESDILSSIPNQNLDFTTFNDPTVINFKESLISPTIRNLLHLVSAKTNITNRDYTLPKNTLSKDEKKIAGDKIYSISILSSKKDVNYFGRKGSLIYSASPFRFYLSNGEKSSRVLDTLYSKKVSSTINYNIQDSIPDFEYGSSESLLGINEIRFKDPISCITFKSESDEARYILGIDVWDELSSTPTITGIDFIENIYSYNSDLTYVKYSDNTTEPNKLQILYPVYVVLEHVEEKDLPIFNIKESLSSFLNENGRLSLSSVIESLGDKVDPDEAKFILDNLTDNEKRLFSFNRLQPSITSNGIDIPIIRNGGYYFDTVSDIDYILTTPYLKDMINYTPLEGTTPDTLFNNTPKELFDMQDRKTYGTVNLADIENGNWGHYKTINSRSVNRYIERRSYDRWTMTGYLGSIDINNSNTINILFPQLEKIIKHRLVNNDAIREKESKLYPILHVFYYKTKLIIIPSDTSFDVFESDNSGFKNNKSLDYIFSGRSKPIDRLSKDVDRVKLGSNVFDVIVPYMLNDRYLKNNQELIRNIIPINGYEK